MRRALGTAVFAGMIGVTVFGLLLTPVFYVAIRWLTRSRKARTASVNSKPVPVVEEHRQEEVVHVS